ncbi:MAG: hypothetical protein EPN82_08200 [Bacteroidetes bacterium]|nr:MAG: hypothetical protein EPN82_08200 [Bacteroidota bacterium]
MKSTHIISILVAFVLIQNCYSQRITLHTSMFSEPKYSLDGGVNFKKLENNMNELKVLMRNCNDCLDKLDSYNTKSSTSEIIGIIGGGCIGWPLGGYLGGGKWLDYYTPMILVGSCAVIIGLLVASSAITSLEEAVELYNRTITNNGIEFFPKYNTSYSFPNRGKIIGISISF